jgi:hypothetical protein
LGSAYRILAALGKCPKSIGDFLGSVSREVEKSPNIVEIRTHSNRFLQDF